MGKKLVCLCSLVEEREIVKAIRKGAVSTGEISMLTGAGRSCGRCHAEIDQLVLIYNKNKPKDLQEKLDFGF